MTNKENQQELAQILFMELMPQKLIAEKVGVTPQTINKWVKKYSWNEKRAAKSITRPELSNKLLKLIADEIEKLSTSEADITAGNIDKLTKLSSMIEKLDKKAGVTEAIETFIAFSKWMQQEANNDSKITSDFLKQVNEFQNKYISMLLASK